jgi:SDR family mycofactocin-dependent oxidoreductase
MELLDGKVAFITGAARGQGRSHAVRLAQEGADIVGVDVCADLPDVLYPLGTWDELEETAKLVQNTGRRMLISRADVRNVEELRAAADRGIAELGHIDIVCANAGVATIGNVWELTDGQWDIVLDVCLKGAFNTVRATLPSMLERDLGGSIIITSSVAAMNGFPGQAPYTAAKLGMVALVKTLVNELGILKSTIRVNSIHPTAVRSAMTDNDYIKGLFAPDVENPTSEHLMPQLYSVNTLPIPWLECNDVSDAVLWLASDATRYVTGIALPIDAGSSAKAPGPW